MSIARQSAKYLFLGSLFSKIVSFLGSILLARILYPEDFGYLLIATIVTGFIQLFGNVGFETFYLQEHTKSQEEESLILNITYKLRLLVNTLLFFIQIAVSYLAEYFYESKMVGEMIRLFALSIPINALTQINMYILRKKLDYKPEVFANFGRDVVGTFAKVILALYGLGALSFAIGAVIGSLVRYLIFIKFQNFKPNRELWDQVLFKKILHFGKHSFLGGIGMYFSNQIDKIMLSTFFDNKTMGNYYFANTQSQSIFSYIISPQRHLILSYTAKNKNNIDFLFNKLSNLGYLIGISLLPITLFFFLYANEIIKMVFGDKWIDSIYIFQIFILYYYITELMFPFSPVITAFGFPEIGAKLIWLRVLALLIGLNAVLQYRNDIYLYLYVYITISILFTVIKTLISFKLMNISYLQYLIKLKSIFVFTFIYIIIYYFINKIFNEGVWQMTACLLLFSFSFIFLNLIVYKRSLVNCLESILGNENRMVGILKGIEK